jgi:hypothetical protein
MHGKFCFRPEADIDGRLFGVSESGRGCVMQHDEHFMFDRIISNLQSLFGYDLAGATALTQRYYDLFRDKSYCDSIGVCVQDVDYFNHEAPMGMAMRVHYHLGLKGDPSPQKYLLWRRDFQLKQRQLESGNRA